MEERQAILLTMQAISLVVLAVSLFSLFRAISVWRELRHQEGEALAVIVVGVLSAFVIAQLLAVLNVFGVLLGNDERHTTLRLVQQAILMTAAIWAAIRLSRLS